MLLIEYFVSFFLPWLYLTQTASYLYKPYNLDSPTRTIFLASGVLFTAVLLPKFSIKPFRISFSVFRFAMLFVGFVLLTFFLLNDNDFRYQDSASAGSKVILRGFYFVFLGLAMLYVQAERTKQFRASYLGWFVCVVLLSSISGVGSAIVLLAFVYLWKQPPFWAFILTASFALPVVVYLALLVKIGDGVQFEIIDVAGFSGYLIERMSTPFAALDNALSYLGNQFGEVDRLGLIIDAFDRRVCALFGGGYCGSETNFYSIAHYTRSLVFSSTSLIHDDSGMSPGVIAGFVLVFDQIGFVISILYLWMVAGLLRGYLSSIPQMSLLCLLMVWILVRVVFQNPVDAMIIFDPSFVGITVILILANGQVYRRT